jgi:hypothetical protein
MQQRRLRLGDILDDYCPRERRITNHAVVAMIEDDVKQTRCTTCDTEHEYKQGKLPSLRRKKDSVAKAYNEVLTAVTTDAAMQAAQATARQAGAAAPESEPVAAAPAEAGSEPIEARADAEEPEPSDADLSEPVTEDAAGAEAAGRVHRRLIRATLPRPENQPVQRPVPEFTMRQPQGRAGKFRSARGPVGRSASGRAGGHAGGHANGNSRGGFGRTGARTDFHRPPRGGQPARRDKKHSK